MVKIKVYPRDIIQNIMNITGECQDHARIQDSGTYFTYMKSQSLNPELDSPVSEGVLYHV